MQCRTTICLVLTFVLNIPSNAFSASNAIAGSQTSHSNPGPSFIVTVRGPENRPIPGARIEISGGSIALRIESVAREDGTYAVPPLSPGRYQIAVTADCYQKAERSLEITSRSIPTALIVLTPVIGAAGCTTGGFEFADTGGLKAGDIAGAVDAAGYSSQAEVRTTELRRSFAAVLVAGDVGKKENAAEFAQVLRANDVLREGRYQEAAQAFREATDHYPRSANLLLGLGVSYFASGHYDEAVDALCKAADLDSADPRSYFFLAHTDWFSQTEGAQVLHRLETYAKARQRDPDAQYYYAIALWHAQKHGRPGIEAGTVEQLLRSAIALDESFAEAHFELGVVLSDVQPEKAIPEFERASVLLPDWTEAHYRLGQLYQRVGESEKAQHELGVYTQLHKQGPSDEEQRLRDEIRRLLDSDKGGHRPVLDRGQSDH